MQTPFYASGFLYSLKTHKILLLQSPWSLLGGEGKEGEDAQETFQRIVSELLEVNLKMKQIYPIYDYLHDVRDKVNYVFYAEVKSKQPFEGLSWVTFAETVKLLFSANSKQDVLVGERVINLKSRQDQNIQYTGPVVS